MSPDDPLLMGLTKEQILHAMKRLRGGDLTVQLPSCVDPIDNEIAETFNAHVQEMNALAGELTYLARDIGTHGRLGVQIEFSGARGTWRELVTSMNTMSADLTTMLRDLFRYVTRIASADFSQDTSARMAGEMLETQQTLEVFADQLAALHRELLRLAHARLQSNEANPSSDT